MDSQIPDSNFPDLFLFVWVLPPISKTVLTQNNDFLTILGGLILGNMTLVTNSSVTTVGFFGGAAFFWLKPHHRTVKIAVFGSI